MKLQELDTKTLQEVRNHIVREWDNNMEGLRQKRIERNMTDADWNEWDRLTQDMGRKTNQIDMELEKRRMMK